MLKFRSALVGAIAIGVAVVVAASASAQTATPLQHKKIFGFQDPQTGVFHPMVHPMPNVATTPTTGKYEVTFDINLVSSLPAGTELACEVYIEEVSELVVTTPTTSDTEVAYYEEFATGTVAAGSAGSKVTCTVAMPYSWAIPAAPKTGGKVESAVYGGYYVYAYNPSATVDVTLREVYGPLFLLPSAVPADASTTSLTVDATL